MLNFCQTIFFEIDCPWVMWTRSVQPFCLLLDTNKPNMIPIIDGHVTVPKNEFN